MIPLYSAEGARWRDASKETIERWLADGQVIVRRNRRGRILCAQFRHGFEPSPFHKTAHMGQRYSVLRQRGDVRVWEHKRLVQRQHIEFLMGDAVNEHDADLFVRAVYRAVPLSILKKERAA